LFLFFFLTITGEKLLAVAGSQVEKAQRYRGYYTAARTDMTFYLRVVKTIFYERAQRDSVSKILFLTREDKSHIFMPPCNVLFI
jgi:hypothetical protein